MYIDGIGIAGYRSFGKAIQYIGPFSRINFLVGQNNSGKSNVLSYIKSQYGKSVISIRKAGTPQIETADRHLSKGNRSASSAVAFCLPLNGPRYTKLLETYPEVSESLRKLLSSKILNPSGTAAWFEFHAVNENDPFRVTKEQVEEIYTSNVIEHREWIGLFNRITNQRDGDPRIHWVPDVLRALSVFALEEPTVKIISAVRRIGDAESTFNDEDFSGGGIITRLAEIQNPAYDEQHKRLQFEEINEFLRKVIGNPSARLEIPFKRDNINVHMDGKTLPLGSLGTGVHEVVILAAAATVLKDQVLCIEEPELHLHPLLQKKLIRYLQAKTTNQYFFTTHSAHLLDTPEASIFHVRMQEGTSTVDPVVTSAQKSVVCNDLGYRASDLLQTNCAIWVEGPSDRIYLNHWISAVDPKLIEGVHYSIMFYGGRLLSHLSAHDPEVTEFISLRKLNRYISIVIDSDKSGPYNKINDTKRRIRDEFDQGPGFAWITQSREIENYVPPSILEEAVTSVHRQASRLDATGQFDHALYFRTSARKLIKENIDKVKIAHAVTQRPAELNVLDLRRKVEKLVEFIRESNDAEITFLD